MTDPVEATKNYLAQRQQAYQTTFKNPVGEEVLKDLFAFCRMYDTTFMPDDRTHALLEGRREVALRILQHLNLSQEELWHLYTRK